MKYTIIALLLIFCLVAADDSYIADCTKLRVGTKSGATDVILDGETTPKFKDYKVTKNDDDVELTANENESIFYVHNIKLRDILSVSASSERNKILSVSTSVTADNSDNKSFMVKVNYDCTKELTGISNVLIKFNLDGNICSSSTVGVRKKCGSQFAYANIEISETSYWGLKKTILTPNGGQTSYYDNIKDKTGLEAVVKYSKDSLNFRVKNLNPEIEGPSAEEYAIEMDPPIVKQINEADKVLYPVLRGAGARKHKLMPGEYRDFKLEFN